MQEKPCSLKILDTAGAGARALILNWSALIVRFPILRQVFHACRRVNAEQLMVAKKNMSQLMQEREPDPFLKAGLVIVDIPYVADDGAAAEIDQHILDSHTEAVFAQCSGIGGLILSFLKGSYIQILIGNQLDLVTEGVLQQASDIQRKKGNP